MAATPMTPKQSKTTSADIRSSDWLGSVSDSERRKEKNRMRMREKRKDPSFRKKERERIDSWLKTESGIASKKQSDTRYARKNGHKEQTLELGRELASKYMHNREVWEKNRNVSLAKKEKHPHARFWSLISPDGRIFKVRNLASFIRDNMGLFDEATCGNRSWLSIHSALSLLSPRRNKTCGVVFGWRWHIDGKHHETFLSVLPNVQAQR